MAVQGCETPADSASRVPSARPPQLAPLPFRTLPGGSALGLPSACRVFFCTWALGRPRGVWRGAPWGGERVAMPLGRGWGSLLGEAGQGWVED